MNNTVLLIDGFGYLYRAYHAMGDLRTADDTPTGAIFGTLNMLSKLRRRYPTQHTVCVMDGSGKNFRHAIDPQYKANRPPLPPDLKIQLAPFNDFINAWGIPTLTIEGVEADDIIATLTALTKKNGMKTIIASADKDLMQLVSDERVTVFDGMKEKIYDSAGVRDKFGVNPEQIADYLALVGDNSDNILGVEKVGPKTAAKWLNAYGNLATITAAAADIRGVVGNNLRTAIQTGRLQLSRRLVTLDENVPLPKPLTQLITAPPDIETWKKLCGTYEFQRLRNALDDYPTAATTTAEPPSTAAECITDVETLQQWADKIRTAKIVAVDTETVGEPVMAAHLVGFSLALDDCAAYVPLLHCADSPAQIPIADALHIIKPILEDDNIIKVLHNGKYDWHVFANAGIALRGILEDTKIAAYVANSSMSNTLSDLAMTHLNHRMIEYNHVVDGKQIKNFTDVDIAKAADYAAEDAAITLQLHKKITSALPSTRKLVYTDIDRPLMPILARIERTGMRIDTAALNAFTDTARTTMQTLETRANKIAGAVFNLNSPRQLESVLFDQLGAKAYRKTGSGARSTDERTLERLAPDYELAAIALEHRTLAKLVGTYAEKLPKLVLPETGRVHTTFTQTAVISGRLSSSSPNLQNIPIRTDSGRLIRRAFIAENGYQLISADYSQIELRLMAHIADDDSLCAAFAAGADIHRQTAAEIFGLATAAVTDDYRRAAKAINFGLIYGMSAFGLARNINISPEQAQLYINRYFARYPKVADFMQKTRKTAPDKGYVDTLFGRRIPIALAHGGRPALERFAINAPIQGSAADLVKKAMLNVDRKLSARKMRTRIILQVHDELVLEVADDEADTVSDMLANWMKVADLRVPLEVHIRQGHNWDDAH